MFRLRLDLRLCAVLVGAVVQPGGRVSSRADLRQVARRVCLHWCCRHLILPV
jgi:hypothetical protein